MNTVNMLEEEWDNLIILDACRYDAFKNVNYIPGDLQMKLSPGGQTFDWFTETFEPKMYDDIVYYSVNPWIHKNILKDLYEGVGFHKLFTFCSPARDKDGNRVPYTKITPEDFVKDILKTYDWYSDKRKILHFMDPHFPWYVGDERMTNMGIGAIVGKFYSGEVTLGDIFQAYRDNIKYVLEGVEIFLSAAEGHTVITSDHGNLFNDDIGCGEIKGWGHGKKTFTPEGEIVVKTKEMHTCKTIRKIPWLDVYDSEKDIELQLEVLGYA